MQLYVSHTCQLRDFQACTFANNYHLIAWVSAKRKLHPIKVAFFE